MTTKQFPFRWIPAAFRPLGGYWFTKQDGRFPNESQGTIEQMYQKWLLARSPENTPLDERGV